MEKILQIGESPIIGYQYHAFPLSIAVLSKNFYPWFHNNYIQLFGYEENSTSRIIDFYNYRFDFRLESVPVIDIEKISSDFIAVISEDMIGFLVDCISNDRYVYVHVDEFYIPNREAYQKRHNFHDILIYGYNLEAREFHVLGFNESISFTATTVSFDDFSKSIIRNADRSFFKRIYLFRLDDHEETTYEFSLRSFIRELSEYLLSRTSSSTANPHDIYGINTLDFITEHYESLYATHQLDKLSVIPLHVLWEHKKSMLEKMQYIEQRYELENLSVQYRQVVKNASVIRNLLLKYNITRQDRNIVGIITKLKETKSQEDLLLNRFLRHCIKFQEGSSLSRPDRIKQDLDRVIADDFSFLKPNKSLGSPSIDIYEQEDDIIAACDIPGIENPEDIEIALEHNVLTVSGTIHRKHEVPKERMHCQERFTGRFCRSVTLPSAVSPQEVSALYRNGVLEIRMPRMRKIGKTTIDIKFCEPG